MCQVGLHKCFIHRRWGSEWDQRRAYEIPLYTSSIRYNLRNIKICMVQTAKVVYQKVIHSVCYYEKIRAKIKESPWHEQVEAECLWNTSCGTSHPAVPEKSLWALQQGSAKSSALAHSACRTPCRYSAMTPEVSWTPPWQFVHPVPPGVDPGPPPVSEGSPWKTQNEKKSKWCRQWKSRDWL